MNKLSFSRNPAVWVAGIKSLLQMIVLFGVDLTTVQILGVVGFFETIGTIIIWNTVFAPTSKDGDKLVEVRYEGQQPEAVK